MSERALISVTNKDGLEEFAAALHKRGIEIVASGGTATMIESVGIPVATVESITSYPSILGGRVKTLHPLIFGAVLGDTNNPDHLKDMKEYGMTPFSLLICNFYDFSSALKDKAGTLEKMIEKIDVGGPSMLRAAAKNYTSCIPLFNTDQYKEIIKDIDDSGSLKSISPEKRLSYSAKAFRYSSDYENIIAGFFDNYLNTEDKLPEHLHYNLSKVTDMRYGENPFQKAALYSRGNEKEWTQLQGKELSYNNYADLQSAREIVLNYDRPAVSIIKHSNPCGFGLDKNQTEAYKKAVTTDPVSYFGGIVGFNTEVNEESALELKKSFLECIIAPSFSEKAREILKKKKNLRLLTFQGREIRPDLELKVLDVGILVQERDVSGLNEDNWECVTNTKFNEEDRDALRIGWDLVKHVKSNAIVFASAEKLLGVGAGQMSRVDSVKIAMRKSREAKLSLKDSILASDAFFPFSDVIDLVKKEKIRGIIQPGGSVRDQEVIDACNEENIFMVFTHQRHFRH
ncbi:bifunctional phosphoribosylaminoimidazolecarboxamide formyltransferase/IMP cyclohydrolase [bacterium]|nr:bifunctional phosphoribosylaminoimidazolecarboxamide formyltransferase/IMP cyclohydrolase [bacterium]